MAQVEYTREALDDLDRLFDFLAQKDPNAALASIYAIQSAIEVLRDHPLIGRQSNGPLRELVISAGRTGYLALYRFRPERGEVRVLALRHQRELDYRP